MNEFRLSVPTYYGSAICEEQGRGNLAEFDTPNVHVLVHEADGVRIVLGTHDYNDRSKPDVQIERRPKGWAIFLHPDAEDDASGYVYFLDDGRSFLSRNNYWSESGAIQVLEKGEDPPEIDDIDLPAPVVQHGAPASPSAGNLRLEAADARQEAAASAGRDAEQKECDRCSHTDSYSGNGHDDLCPEDADQTDDEWICRVCRRRGTFEAMGGNDADDPRCCGVLCRRIAMD